MSKSVFTCQPNDTLRSVLEKMVNKKIGGIVVEENNKAVGIISERDALKFIQESKELLDQAVSTCMSTPVSTIHERQTVLNAQTIMDNLGIRRLVVVDDDEEIAGIVSRHDLIKHILEYYVEILREMIDRQKSLVTNTQAKLDEKIIFQNAVKSLPHTIVLMTQSEGIIEFVNFKEKAFCNIPKINIGDNLNNLESNFFELLKNKTWKEKVVSGESVHKIVKVTNQTNNSCYLHTSISAILDEEKNFKGYLYIARDISQEQTLELQLKRLSNQLQEAYHIAHIGNFELDAKTLSAFWSDEVCDIVGIKRETVGGPELLKTLVREKDFEQIESSLISALQTGSEHEMIYEVFPKNGTKSRWVECRARRELNEDGTPRCLIGTIQDITQRVEAQKQARENEDSMILALESAGHGVWDYNAKENIQYLSPQYKSMLGYDNDEMDNTLEAFVNLLHPDDLSQVQSTIESFFINKHYKGDKFHHTFRMKTKDGSYRWILSNGNVISTDKDGTIVRVIGTHTDISEQQKLQEELLQINKKLTKLSDTIPAMIYQYQLYPDGSSRFPYASVGIEDIYEVTPKQVMDDAQSVFDVVYPDDLAMVVDSITKSAETMQLWNLDYRVTLPKKGLRWLRGTAKPQKLEDGAILWHGYIQDITKEKNNFNILRENERKLRQSATVFENTTEGVMITDTNSIILDVNEAFCQITGRERNETLGKPASILKSGKHNKKFYQDM